jgi:hypothetical protein
LVSVDLGGLVGCQEPTVSHWPAYDVSRGGEVVELAERAGLVLDPWQRFAILHGHGVRPDGLWAAFEVGVAVARQNGKGGIIEAVELGALFVFEDRLTVHSAHQFDTSLEAFRRLLDLIEELPELDQQVKRVSRSHGEEGIELKSGRRIRFRTRTKGGGRGFSGDKVILDEAMFLPELAIGALLPTVSARPNPQVWYTGSAVDWQMPNDDGVVFARVRVRGHKGDDPRLAWFEWTADPDGDPDATGELATDRQAWVKSNPALGIRISAEHIANEQRSMDPRTFAVERLGVGDWPDPDAVAGQGIDPETWAARADLESKPNDPVCFAFDVTPNRSFASICVAGRRDDGKFHVERVEHRPGTKWLPDRLAELVGDHPAVKPVCDGASPAAALLARLADLEVEVVTTNAREHAQACGILFDAVEEDNLKHLGTPELAAAVRGAVKRPLGDAWAWSRKASHVDISPLVAATLAVWGVASQDGESVYAARGVAVI